MEDTTMIKKEYMKPAVMTDNAIVEQMLAESITSVNTTGLDDGDALNKDDDSGDPWDIAW